MVCGQVAATHREDLEMRLTSRQLYYIFLATVVVCMLLSCKKHVDPEQKWRTPDDKPLEHRSNRYDLPEDYMEWEEDFPEDPDTGEE